LRTFLLRHAIAAPHDPDRYPEDGERPLTPHGRERMERAARGLRTLEGRFDLILTSPLARAVETARILSRAFRPVVDVKVLRPLSPGGGAGGVIAGLSALPATTSVVLVGHEPDLTRLAGAFVLEHRDALRAEFKKGGVCRIDFDDVPRLGDGRLIYLLPPRVLRGYKKTAGD
jgi:phosphohistidine phosphatase